jgi:AcrR family transcriptional regulator
MDDIGALAGVTGPALYHHFSKKQQVLAAVMWQLGDDLHESMMQGLPEFFTPWERLEHVITRQVQTIMRREASFPLLFVEEKHLTEEDLATTKVRRRRAVGILADVILEVRADFTREQAVTMAAALYMVAGSHTFLEVGTSGAELERLTIEMELAVVRGTRAIAATTASDGERTV